jgi:nitrogen fixation NifU-like protein
MPEPHDEERHLDSLYRDVLFDHYRRPHNRGPLEGAQIVTRGNNPICGDRITVYGKLDGHDCMEQVSFEGRACAICTASASMMTEAVRGKPLDAAGDLARQFKEMMRGERPFQAPPEVPDLEALSGVMKFPVRIKCATLPWTTLANGILAYRAGRQAGETNTEKE